jgi:glycosyltransferase involved in cell wall biosynthesis
MTAASLTAVLIVRDEAEHLVGCLESLVPFVDEIVVHDTGSTDDTVSIARRLGAVVTQGTWTNDFAAARNDALRSCRTDWLLSIDADERLRATDALRHAITASRGDVLTVEVHNDHHAMNYVHRAPRLLRVADVRWAGRVHEQPVRIDSGPLHAAALDATAASLDHLGYADAAVQQRKSRRNAAIAAAELERLDDDVHADETARSFAALDLARSAMSAGDVDRGRVLFDDVRRRWPGRPAARSATDALARHLLAVGDDATVVRLVDELRQQGADHQYCNWLAAQAYAQLGEVEVAWSLLQSISEVVDTDGRRYPAEHVAQMRSLLEQLVRAHGRSLG